VKTVTAGIAMVLMATLAAPAWAAVAGVGVSVSSDSSGGEAQVAQIPAAVGKADLVAVVKVTEIAGPKKDEEEAKDGEKKEEAAPQPRQAILGMGALRAGGEEKTVSAEVVEVLRGDKDVKSVKFPVTVFKQGDKEMMMITVKRERNVGGNKMQWVQSTGVPFPLAKDKNALVFLKKEGEKKDAEGKVVEREWSLVEGRLFGEPLEKPLAAAKEALKKIAEWENPPKLSAEDEAAVKKLIAELGSEVFATRENATKALIDKGGAVKPLVEEAAKNSTDAEVKQRCDKILEALKPEMLKGPEANAGAGDGIFTIQGAGGGVVQMHVEMPVAGQ
jgi:hypothetical protein